MQSLCYLNLPELRLDTLNNPSVTMGGRLAAPKRPETHPKSPDFSWSISISISISVQPYHSRNDYVITMLPWPTSTVSKHTISPVYDHCGLWGAENTPKFDSKWPFFGWNLIIWLFDCTSKSILFPLTKTGVVGKIWSPRGPFWSSTWGPGGQKHPQIWLKMAVFG